MTPLRPKSSSAVEFFSRGRPYFFLATKGVWECCSQLYPMVQQHHHLEISWVYGFFSVWIINFWLVVWLPFLFSHSVGNNNHPNWRTLIFFRVAEPPAGLHPPWTDPKKIHSRSEVEKNMDPNWRSISSLVCQVGIKNAHSIHQAKTAGPPQLIRTCH